SERKRNGSGRRRHRRVSRSDGIHAIRRLPAVNGGFMLKRSLSFLGVTSSIVIGMALAQDPDNTKNNKRDRDPQSQQSTPQNATATKVDAETLKNIRKAV